MLEVKNLSKLYTQKDGTPVKALTDVTISFPETGMVFLLGKSGSGKSTLLNICSGLDSPTSGEILVKGRSSRDFSQSDFDSYRNTFVGFIFQEYNILNEFSVKDNIALALDLQDKPKDDAIIEKTLEDMGLKNFANRRPNTLSGGEKQRIAIARALVKNPEIIMADEPSGALDSETGKQIFEILKKMSKDKLIIVVSHDRDFAEQYGDRIIELKDGKVISDVSKISENQVAVTENIEYMGNLLHIRNGASLNQSDFEKLQNIFREANHEIIVAISEEDVEEVKKSKNIKECGTRVVFKQSIETIKKIYKPEDSKFISSKLPLKHAFKIGASGLKNKPVRLAFTLILCIAAFTLFGLSSTMLLYNNGSIFKKTLSTSDLNVIKVHKEYAINIESYKNNKLQGSYQKTTDTYFIEDELESLKSVYGNDIFGGVSVSYRFFAKNTKWAYWTTKVNAIAYLESDNSLYNAITGTYPQNDDEICISSYMANSLFHSQVYNTAGKEMDLESAEDIIGKQISLAGNVCTVTGIFNCGELPVKYDVLKTELNYASSTQLYKQLLNDYESTLEDGLYLTVLTTNSGVKAFAEKQNSNQKGLKSYQTLSLALESNALYTAQKYHKLEYKGLSNLPKGITLHTLDTDTASLKENEIIVYEELFYQIVSDTYSLMGKKTDNADDVKRYSEIESVCKKQIKNPDTLDSADNLAYILKNIKQDKVSLMVYVKPYDLELEKSYSTETELKIAGLWETDQMLKRDKILYTSDNIANSLINTQKTYASYHEVHTTNYIKNAEAFYSDIFLLYDHSAEQTKNYTLLYKDNMFRQDDSRIKFSGNFMDNLESINETVKEMSKLFLLIGTTLAIFAALLLSNFISVSITQKQKEIGILRAMGAKGTEVFKIFFVETFIIVLTCIVVSTIASMITCHVINGVMSNSIGAELFIFSIWSFLLLVVIAIITAFLATYFPVSNAAKKKPIESITAAL